MKHSKLIATISLLLVMLLLFGCTGTSTAPAPTGQAGGDTNSTNSAQEPNGFVGISGGGSEAVYSSKDTIHFRINADIATLDPHKTSGTGNERIVQYQFYESLFGLDMFNGTVEVNQRLAESYKYLDAEKTQLELTLRQGVKFHNGETMTADDVVYSLERAASTGFNTVVTSFIDHVAKTSDYTVVVSLKFAYSPILRVLASGQTSIVNQKYCEENPDAMDRNPCGTGPYVFENWVSGDSITLNAFPDYWRGEAAIKHGKFVIIADNSSYLISLENGEVDTSNAIGSSDSKYIQDNANLGYSTSSTGTGGRSILFNCTKGVFSDVRMRQAVAHAINREEIWMAAYDSTGRMAETNMSSSLPEWPDHWEPLAYDPELAKKLIAEAGYPNGLTIRIPTIDNAQYSKATIVIQEQLAQVGINLEIDLMTRAAWNEKIITNSDFEISYWAIVPDYEDADAILYKFHSSNLNGKGNFFNYSNPEMDKLLDEGRQTETGAERTAIYRKALEILRDDAPVIPVHFSEREVAFNINLKGMKAVPEQKYYFFDYYWAE